MIETKNHPCFNQEAAGTFGRIHLPVAARCNVQCNYCNRDYDCVNESRPGVTSEILSPAQAVHFFKAIAAKVPISVAGIAGPGDPFASPDPTLETLELLREEFPDLILCVSTNGLNLLPYVPRLTELAVSHVTITINAIDPQIGASVYSWVRVKKRVFRGSEGACLILENQLAALSSLKAHGITVKINSVVLPGINDQHIPTIAKEVKKRGADLFNCIPLIPVEGSLFEYLEEPGHNTMSGIKNAAAKFLPQMKHCRRCRADAAGLLHQKDPGFWLDALNESKKQPLIPGQKRPYIAAATREGFLISQHLGEAANLSIYQQLDNGEIRLLEQRLTPGAGTGNARWEQLAGILSDCDAVLVNGAGPNPVRILEKSGIKVHLVEGFLDQALKRAFSGESLEAMVCRSQGCGSGCSGKGNGCG